MGSPSLAPGDPRYDRLFELAKRGELLQNMITFDGPKWSTPLTVHAGTRSGDARLVRKRYPVGYYQMEGHGGAEVYRIVGGKLPLTVLEVRDPQDGRGANWQEWMLDDPLHWIGMGERVAQLPPGRIVIAGLGLGLMLHHIAASRPDITDVRVIERNADVIDLIMPTLPADPRVTIVEADFWEYIQINPDVPDAVLWDLAVGDVQHTSADLMRAVAEVGAFWPEAKLVRFGIRANHE